jgi:membrane protein implicated in regulation of membrane protease activity
MYLVAIAWLYVVVMMAAAEATSANGTLLGAFFTFVLYGALPLSVVLYVMGGPARKRRRRALEAQAASLEPADASSSKPDGSDHAPSDAVAAERKEP